MPSKTLCVRLMAHFGHMDIIPVIYIINIHYEKQKTDNMGIAGRIMHTCVSETDLSPEVVLSGGHFEI